MKSQVIFLVEDVEEMRFFLVEFFRRALGILEGTYVIREASTVAEARKLLTRDRPALVLLDEVLPAESPLDWVGELQREGVPVVLISGLVEQTSQEELPRGVLARVSKPESVGSAAIESKLLKTWSERFQNWLTAQPQL